MATNNKGWTKNTTKKKRRQQRIQRYWQDRETDARLERLKRAGAYDKEIERLYKQMLSEIQKEIDAFYQKYATDEGITMAEAKRRASKLDMEAYSKKAEKYVAEKNFSKQANAEMKLYNMTMKANRLELLKAQIGLEMVSSFDDLEKLFGEKITAETVAEFKRQAGILGESILKNASSSNIDALINGSFHNASFSERIWAHQDLLRAELDKLLTRGIIGGRNPRELARELRKTIDSSVYNSERLLRTEMARVQTEAQKNAYKEVGFGEYMYIACGNRDVCEICKALDGQTFELKEMEPGTNAPPMHPNCHCSTAPYEDDDEYEAWLSYLEKGGTTENWDAFAKKKWRESGKVPEPGRNVEDLKGVHETSNFNELREYLQAKYGIYTPKSINGLDFKSVRDSLHGFEDMIRKYPDIAENLIEIEVISNSDKFMGCNGRVLQINADAYGTPGRVKSWIDQLQASTNPYFPVGASTRSLGAHEAAHALELAITHMRAGYDWRRTEEDWGNGAVCNPLVSKAIKNVRTTRRISEYSKKDSREFLAEAFHDVYINGTSANPLSIEIVRLAENRYKKLKGQK